MLINKTVLESNTNTETCLQVTSEDPCHEAFMILALTHSAMFEFHLLLTEGKQTFKPVCARPSADLSSSSAFRHGWFSRRMSRGGETADAEIMVSSAQNQSYRRFCFLSLSSPPPPQCMRARACVCVRARACLHSCVWNITFFELLHRSL